MQQCNAVIKLQIVMQTMLVVWAGTIHLIIKWGKKIDPSKFIDSKMPPEHSIINSLSDDD